MSGTKIGKSSDPSRSRRSGFVQTEQAAHEAWAKLVPSSPKAAALLHVIVGRMDRGSNALVISHENLASLLGNVSTRTVKNHLKTLTEEKWIQVVSLGKGAMNAYVVNSVVAWGKGREKLGMSQFTAQVIASAEDQEELGCTDLRRIPVVFGGEQQLPSGEGLEPPSQPNLGGLEPDLPSIDGDRHLERELPLDE